MKLIATKSIRNNFPERVRLPDNAAHPLQIDKGTIFEIGNGEDLKKLQPEDRQLVAQLFTSGCVAEASDEKAVAIVREDIAVEAKREAAREAQLRKWSALPKV